MSRIISSCVSSSINLNFTNMQTDKQTDTWLRIGLDRSRQVRTDQTGQNISWKVHEFITLFAFVWFCLNFAWGKILRGSRAQKWFENAQKEQYYLITGHTLHLGVGVKSPIFTIFFEAFPKYILQGKQIQSGDKNTKTDKYWNCLKRWGI